MQIVSDKEVEVSSRLHHVVVHPQQRSLTLTLYLRVIRMAGNHLVMDLAVHQVLRRKEAVKQHS